MNVFQYAAEKKLRFKTSKGLLTTEDLFSLPLVSASADAVSLNSVAQDIYKELNQSGNVSFVQQEANATTTKLEISLDIVKEVIAKKEADQEALKVRRDNKELKQKLLEIKAGKEADALTNLSIDELEKRIAAL